MPVTSSSAPSDFAWRVLGLLNIYRLLVPIVLISMQWFAGPQWQWALATLRPPLFASACIAYFTMGVLLIIARRLEWSSDEHGLAGPLHYRWEQVSTLLNDLAVAE